VTALDAKASLGRTESQQKTLQQDIKLLEEKVSFRVHWFVFFGLHLFLFTLIY
jgi:hypothetical protein